MAPTKTETKTPEDAERDVVEARADLAESLEEIEQRLKPDALIDQGVAYFRGDGRRYVDGLYRRAEANPLAVALIGIGVAWLALGPTSRPRGRSTWIERDRRAAEPIATRTVPYERAAHVEPRPAEMAPSGAEPPAVVATEGDRVADDPVDQSEP